MTDLCLLNGAFYAQDPDRPRAMAPAIRQGRFVALRSDCPVADQRRDGTPSDGWYSEQRLTVAEAVWGLTLGPALVTGRDAEWGSITPGKLADLVVLDRDILGVEPSEIAEAQVVMTVLGGAVVYRR